MGSAAGYLKGDDYDGIVIEITKLNPDRRNVSKTIRFFVYFDKTPICSKIPCIY